MAGRKFPALAELGGPIFVATGLFMAATVIALIASWLLTRTLPIMPMVSGVVVFVFGGLTLYLQDDIFIKMKPTIVNTLFGGVLLGGLLFGRSLLGYVFDSAFQLDAEGWRKLTFRWGLFFLFLAVVNEVVWREFFHRRLGYLQGLGHDADHASVHLQPDAADPAPFAGGQGRAGRKARQIEIRKSVSGFPGIALTRERRWNSSPRATS